MGEVIQFPGTRHAFGRRVSVPQLCVNCAHWWKIERADGKEPDRGWCHEPGEDEIVRRFDHNCKSWTPRNP